MVGSMYAAISGLRAHQQKMNVIGNNIANVNTYGYKTQRTTFKESMYSSVRGSTGGTATTGGVNASQIGYGCTVGTIDMNMRTGNYAISDQSTDVMIDGDGFFFVGDINNTGYATDGSVDLSALKLTRVGNFTFDENGYLTDGQGNVVYGFAWDGTTGAYNPENLVPIQLPPKDPANIGDPTAERAEVQSISIGKNGEITGTNADGTVHVGCISLAYVPNPNGLTHVGGPYYQAGGNSGDLRAGSVGGVVSNAGGGGAGGTDTLVNFASGLVSGALEMSNVDISNEFADLITTQRGFQANTKIITVTDEMLADLVAMKR